MGYRMRVGAVVALTGLVACGPFAHRHVREKAVLVIQSRQRGVVVSKIDELPVERAAGTWLTERLNLDPGKRLIELAYAHPSSGPLLGSGSVWGGGTTYARPRVRVELEAKPGHTYRVEQEELRGGCWRAWMLDERTGQTVAGPVQVWPS